MKRRIHVSDLTLGMRVVELDRAWLDSPFLFQGFTVSSVDELSQVRQLCDYVFVEDASAPAKPAAKAPVREAGAAASLATAADLVTRSRPAGTSLERELETARMVFKRAVDCTREVFQDARAGRAFDARGTQDAVREIVASALRNSSALLWYAQLQSREGYNALHAVKAAVYAAALGGHLGYPEDTLVELGIGALLHDIGKLKLPAELLQKSGSLTPAERALMQKHTAFGFRLLEHTPDLPRSALLVALQHHENVDGSGYPKGCLAERTHQFSRLVAVVDRYVGMTSDRPQRDGVSPEQAVKTLYELRGTELDEKFVDAFIQLLGVYPVGSMVELSSGEVGIVIGNSPKQRLRPKVLVILNERKEKALPLRIVDLQQIRTYGTGAPYDIRRALDPHSYGMDLNPYIKGYKSRALSAA